VHRQLVRQGIRPRVGNAPRAEANHERAGGTVLGEEPVRSDEGVARVVRRSAESS
jgi:hypothetical protein